MVFVCLSSQTEVRKCHGKLRLTATLPSNDILFNTKKITVMFPIPSLQTTLCFLKPIKQPFLLKHKTHRFSIEIWDQAKELSVDDSRGEAFVRNLQPLTSYEIRICSFNVLGQSDWSSVLLVTTEEEGKTISD